MRLVWFWLAVPALATGCGDDALDAVRVCGDLAVPADLAAVRVTALDLELNELASGVAELDGERPRQLPVVVSLPAVSGQHVVRAQALSADGTEVARMEVLVGGAGDAVVLNLGRDCLGQVCALGQTCVAGGCTITPDAAMTTRCQAPAVTP